MRWPSNFLIVLNFFEVINNVTDSRNYNELEDWMEHTLIFTYQLKYDSLLFLLMVFRSGRFSDSWLSRTPNLDPTELLDVGLFVKRV